MMKRLIRSILFALIVMPLVIGSVFAHGGQQAGDYEITFGWRNEPAFAGQFNGPEIYIKAAQPHGDDHGGGHNEGEDHSSEDAFPADIAVNLRAEVTFGPAKTTVFFRQAYQSPGHYIADLIPSRAGDYVFHITGTIGDTTVDLTFDSTDGEFSTVQPLTDIVFPAPETPDLSALEARIAALEALIAELTAQ